MRIDIVEICLGKLMAKFCQVLTELPALDIFSFQVVFFSTYIEDWYE